MTDRPLFARSILDRAARRRTDPRWLDDAWRQAKIVVIDKGKARVSGGGLVFATASSAPAGQRLFLGVDVAGVPYFAVVAPLPDAAGGSIKAYGIREATQVLTDLDADVLMTAVALANWHTRHGYSPGSGAVTVAGDGGWVRADDAGEQMWPRTDPAVIVLVHDGVAGEQGRCLLGRGAGWPGRGRVPVYSCLAGFVEPGESAEQTVYREVAEEVGVHIRDLGYVASQPWPFPGSLMLGFLAEADPDEPIVVDPAEIADAQWFSRSRIRAAEAADPDAGFGVAAPPSIANFLIMTWLNDPPAGAGSPRLSSPG